MTRASGVLTPAIICTLGAMRTWMTAIAFTKDPDVSMKGTRPESQDRLASSGWDSVRPDEAAKRDYLSPARLRSCVKRGSDRSGSKIGSTCSTATAEECASAARSSHANAWSRSPSPVYATANS